MNRVSLVAIILMASFQAQAAATASRDCEPKIDCEPKRTCTLKTADRDCSAADSAPCVLERDNRDCEPRWLCETTCQWFDLTCVGSKSACEANKAAFRSTCEASKAAQNAAYAARKAECQSAWEKSSAGRDAAAARAACEESKTAQNEILKAEFSSCQSQLTLERLECERNRFQMRLACESGQRGPFSCDAAETMRSLRGLSLAYADRTQERIVWLTDPNARSSGAGWIDTACVASGIGVPQYDAILSSDGFWTIELKLDSFVIGDLQKPSGNRYIRLVIRPRKWGGGKAHDFASTHYITRKDRVSFGGPVVIDRSSPVSLEVHPVDQVDVVAPPSPAPAAPK